MTGMFLAGMVLGALALATLEPRLRIPDAPATGTQGGEAPIGPVPGERSLEQHPPSVTEGKDDPWSAVDAALIALNRRVTALEARLAGPVTAGVGDTDTDSPGSATAGKLDQTTLMAAGVAPEMASAILRRQNRFEMQRLELRDRASREGWLDSERFVEELRELDGIRATLREEIGDAAYDRFLYLTGQPNRVIIDSVIDESPASVAGLEAGDILLDYADRRIFSWSELRDATRAGERGEYVWLRIERNGETLELTLPRGPLGVRLDMDRIDPEAQP